MSNLKIKNINFEGGELLGVRAEDGKIYLGIKKACMDIGLSEGQARRQVENVQEDLVLNSNYRKFRIVQTEGDRQVDREVIGLAEEVVTLWLAKIHLTPSMQKENPKAIEKLITYQLKAAKVLHEAFSLESIKDELGLQGEIVELKQEVVQLKNKVNELIDNTTINSRQAQKLLKACRERVSEMLGGAHSDKYKEYSRMYFKNMWNNFSDNFGIGSYKDLNPMQFSNGFRFIRNWSMI